MHAAGKTVAWLAARHCESSATLRVLVKHGASLHSVSNNDQTLLHAAALKGSLDTVKYLHTNTTLLQYQHAAQDGAGNLALHLACSGACAEIARLVTVNFCAVTHHTHEVC